MQLKKRWRQAGRSTALFSLADATANESKRLCAWRNRAAFRCASKTASSSIALPAPANIKAWWRSARRNPFWDSKTCFGEKTGHGLLVLLDGVEDPHNLGAIVRTSLAAGATGVVIPERRAAGLTDTVERASAGALAHLPVARVKNLVRAMEEMKEAGYWLVGLDERAEKSYTEVDLKASVGVVLGSEGEGLHELTRKRCDFLVSIPTPARCARSTFPSQPE